MSKQNKETATKKSYEYVRKTFTYEGHRYEVKGHSLEEALEKKAELKAKLARGEAGISGNMLVRVWAKEYINTYITPRIRPAGSKKRAKDSLTEKSAKMYTEKINGYIVPAIGGLRMKEVTATHLQRILNSQAGKSFSHVNKLLTVTQQLFRKAYQERLILFDPSDGLTMPFVEKKTRRSLTEAEEAVFHAVAATHKHGLWAEFHIGFGVRPGEVPPIRVKDLDFKANRLYVSQAVESGTGAVKDPKTEAGVRAIPIPPYLKPRLEAFVSGRGPFEYLFPSETGGMMAQGGINRRWKSFKRAMDIYMGAKVNSKGKVKPETSKIAKDLTLYCTRHTFCTELGAKGIDASVGRFVTGHADVATLANIYMHSNDAIIQSIEDKLYPKAKEEAAK